MKEREGKRNVKKNYVRFLFSSFSLLLAYLVTCGALATMSRERTFVACLMQWQYTQNVCPRTQMQMNAGSLVSCVGTHLVVVDKIVNDNLLD